MYSFHKDIIQQMATAIKSSTQKNYLIADRGGINSFLHLNGTIKVVAPQMVYENLNFVEKLQEDSSHPQCLCLTLLDTTACTYGFLPKASHLVVRCCQVGVVSLG